MRARHLALLLALQLPACRAVRTPPPAGDDAAAVAAQVRALADSVLAAARARDVDRFAAHFAPGDELRYVLNTRAPIGQAALRAAFGGMLARQASFEPRWLDGQVQLLAHDAAVFTGAFRTAARDTTGRAWGASGIVTFAARRGPSGWRIVNWHTSEVVATP